MPGVCCYCQKKTKKLNTNSSHNDDNNNNECNDNNNIYTGISNVCCQYNKNNGSRRRSSYYSLVMLTYMLSTQIGGFLVSSEAYGSSNNFRLGKCLGGKQNPSTIPRGGSSSSSSSSSTPRGGSTTYLSASSLSSPITITTEVSEDDLSIPPSPIPGRARTINQKKVGKTANMPPLTIAQTRPNNNGDGTPPPDMLIPVDYIAETNLPTNEGHFRLRAYRIRRPSYGEMVGDISNYAYLDEVSKFMGDEPCVIYCTDLPPGNLDGDGVSRSVERNVNVMRDNVPVRIHDQCFTSEVFGSKRCDCKQQLKLSLEFVQKNGGAVIYIQQEGRGIGLANKVAAYALQDEGFDTVDANLHLGFPDDCRTYGIVPSILEDIGINSIQLITNNPRKVERLRAVGVNVAGTIPMVVARANKYNKKYLATKAARMNHQNFDSMLAQSSIDTVPSDFGGAKILPVTGDPAVVTAQGMNAASRAALQALLDEDDDDRSGVRADAASGYCFGRKSVEDAIAATQRGELVVVVDDEDRENEGDFICSADMITPKSMSTIVRYSSGVVCVSLSDERCKELDLVPMTASNEDPKGTAFTVSVDAAKKHGITTGISALERAKTIKLLADPTTTRSDFNRPGHIFPLRAKAGGTIERDGHTEAALDLSKLAGHNPCGVLCEIVSEEDPLVMMKLPEIKRFCKREGFTLTSIVDIAQYRLEMKDELGW